MPDFEFLASLVAPAPLQVFLDCFTQRRHLHLANRAPSHFDDVLSLADIDGMLELGSYPAAFINVVANAAKEPFGEWADEVKSGRGTALVSNPEKLLNSYRNGATLILNRAVSAIPKLSRACRRLAEECGLTTGANIYVTPPGGQGFAAHGDEHDVLVLQIHGKKHWTIHAQEPVGLVSLEVTAGDLLFIPRMMFHEARCSEEPSVHVTISLTPVYGFDLLSELALVGQTHPLLQNPVPSRLATAAERDAFEGAFAEAVTGMVRENPIPSLLERHYVARVKNQRPGWPGRFSDAIHEGQLRPESVLRRRSNALVSVVRDGQGGVVSFSDKQITVPNFLLPSLDQLLGEDAFRIRELNGLMTEQGKVALAKRFVEAGILTIVAV